MIDLDNDAHRLVSITVTEHQRLLAVDRGDAESSFVQQVNGEFARRVERASAEPDDYERLKAMETRLNVLLAKQGEIGLFTVQLVRRVMAGE
jgi:hypothetical protein